MTSIDIDTGRPVFPMRVETRNPEDLSMLAGNTRSYKDPDKVYRPLRSDEEIIDPRATDMSEVYEDSF